MAALNRRSAGINRSKTDYAQGRGHLQAGLLAVCQIGKDRQSSRLEGGESHLDNLDTPISKSIVLPVPRKNLQQSPPEIQKRGRKTLSVAKYSLEKKDKLTG